jgi:hypothetical protein
VHRRTATLVVLVATLCLALPTAALAVGATLRGPSDGVVTGPTSLDLRIHREPFEAISRIDATLYRGGAPLDGSRARELCEGLRDCPNGSREADYRIPFDPRDGAPFLANGGRTLANGPYELVVGIQVGQEVQQRPLPLTLSVPPAAPSDLRVSTAGTQVSIQWTRGAEPDLAGHRIERSSGSGWARAGEVGGTAEAYVDEPGPGSHRYRVVVIRPNGRGGSYEVTSAEVTATVDAPVTADDRRGDGPERWSGARRRLRPVGGRPRRESEPLDLERSDADAAPRGPPDEGDGAQGDDARAGSSRASGAAAPRRSFQAPSVNLDRDGADTPPVPWDDPEYFQETLDYDDAVAAAPRERGDDGEGNEVLEALLAVPGMGSLTGGLDDSRFAIPIAGGLLMTAIGLHLWRWLKLPVV